MPGMSSLVSWIGAVRSTAISSVTCSAVICSIGPAQPIPALLTSTSMPPGPAASVAAAASAAAPAGGGEVGRERQPAGLPGHGLQAAGIPARDQRSRARGGQGTG